MMNDVMGHRFIASGFLLVWSSFRLVGCSSPENGQQVWTTKQESIVSSIPQSSPVHFGEPFSIENDAALREKARSIVLQAAESPNPLLRAHAIEALLYDRQLANEIVQRHLGDENRGVRFAAAVIVGKLKLQQLVALVKPLMHDESESVQAAAIFALRRCDENVDINPLAKMLLSDDAEVKGNVAYILGELDDSSAISMLRFAAGKGLTRASLARRKVVELQLAEAMVKLGAHDELEVIRAKLFAPGEEGELVALACQMCGELKDEAAIPNLFDLATRTGRRQQSAEVRMAATRSIALIDPLRAPMAVPVAYVSSERFELRAQAAHTLGVIAAWESTRDSSDGHSRNSAGAYLIELLHDPNPLVQISAAAAVLLSSPTPESDWNRFDN